MLTDTLPAGLAFGSMTVSQGSCTPVDARTVTCALGNLASGASATATLVGTPTTTATITNTARVTAAEFDPDLVNNSTSQGIGIDFIWLKQSEFQGRMSFATVAVDTSGVYVTTLETNQEARHTTYCSFSSSTIRAAPRSGDMSLRVESGWGVACRSQWRIHHRGHVRWWHLSIPLSASSMRMALGCGHVNLAEAPLKILADIAVAAGGVYVAVNSRCFVRKYDTNGTELWTQSLSGCCPISIAADASGVYVLRLISGWDISKYDVNGNAILDKPRPRL